MIEQNYKVINKVIQSKKTFVFDFDGVLADSVKIKTEAFAELYKPYGMKIVNKVVKHHCANGGMSRFEKFKFYHEEFLDIILNDDSVLKLSKKFSNIVVERVIKSNEIPGAYDFLEAYCINNKKCFINSATPIDEMKEIIYHRKMSKFFISILGSPNSKNDNLNEIFLTDSLPSETIFFGDASSDFYAASVANCEFIGIGDQIKPILEVSKEKYGLLSNFKLVV